MRRIHDTARRALFDVFLATISLAPLPFGSVDFLATSVLCMVLGLVLVGAAALGFGRASMLFFAPVLIVILVAGLVLWQQLAPDHWFGQADPIWVDAARLLNSARPAAGAVVRDEAFFALGAPLANLLALMCGIVFGADRVLAGRLIRALAWAGAVYAAFGICSYLVDPLHILGYEKLAHRDNLTGTFLNRNTAAVYFGSCAILWLLIGLNRLVGRVDLQVDTLGDFWAAIRDVRRFLLLPGCMLVLCLVAMALTQSRAGVSLSLAALPLTAVGFLWRYIPKRRFLLVVLPAACVSVAVLLLFGSGVNARFDLHGFSDEGRFQAYRSTLRMIADRPWLGVGLGSYPWTFPNYRLPEMSMWGTWTRAHSTPLELAAELGLPLSILIAVVWFAALAALARGFHRRRHDRIIPLAGLSVSLLALIHSCGDFSLQIPGFAVTVFAIAGTGLGQSVSGRMPEKADKGRSLLPGSLDGAKSVT